MNSASAMLKGSEVMRIFRNGSSMLGFGALRLSQVKSA